VRGAIEGDYTVAASSTAGPLRLGVRRAQLALEAHANVAVGVGALRFVLGPTLPLWTVRPSGVPDPHTSIIPSVGLTARILYHLDLGRVFVTAGVTFEASFIREELTLTGVGLVARTPLFEIGPILGIGANL
jgi:hypothetical protein